MKQVKEPTLLVGSDVLDFKKMNGRIPRVVTTIYLHPTTLMPARDVYFSILTEVDLWLTPPHRLTTSMVDCDGDAVWTEYPFSVFDEIAGRLASVGLSPFRTECREEDINELKWYQAGQDLRSVPKHYAQDRGQLLIPTVIVDGNNHPLGITYSSRQSLKENFRPKEVAGVEGPLRAVTLHSRSRGIWPKGLKNPNDDRNASLPDRLEQSSGNYLIFRGLKSVHNGTAVLIEADVPEGHGFCHERYLAETGSVTGIYSDEGLAPRNARAYRSCFHRLLFVQDNIPEPYSTIEPDG